MGPSRATADLVRSGPVFPPLMLGIAMGILPLVLSVVVAGPSSTVSEARVDETGVRVHEVRSEYQSGATVIRVMLPDDPPPRVDERLPVVYVLPVEAGDEHRYGDGLGAIRRLDPRGRPRAIFVAPTFSQLPWYADHPTDPQIRQEAYLLRVVVPHIDAHYPARPGAEGRRLLGFSKSGWGAFSLLLRHPEVFGRAVAWDAPLMMDAPGRYGSGPIFGDADTFASYRLTTLVKTQADRLGSRVRLIHIGYGNFRDEHERFEQVLKQAGVPHEYVDGPKRSHHWEGGWLPEALHRLLND